MIVGRVFGWLLVGLGLAILAWEALTWFRIGTWHLLAAGELWFRLDRESLNVTQTVIQRYLLPFLWDPTMQTLLLLPAWAVFAGPGLLLIWLCRRRRRGIFT